MEEIRKIDGLVDLIPMLERDSFGAWADTGTHAGTADDPIPIPFVEYEDYIGGILVKRIYEVVDANPNLNLKDYSAILEENGLEWSDESLRNADTSRLDEECVLAMLVAIVRADRFSEGILLHNLEEGYILRWLKMLA